jgi:hypothetical protein
MADRKYSNKDNKKGNMARIARNNAISVTGGMMHDMGPAHRAIGRAFEYGADAVGADDYARSMRHGRKAAKIIADRKKKK